jgi:hypothetical protein
MTMRMIPALVCGAVLALATGATAQEAPPSFATLLEHRVTLKPGLDGVHPRVFVDAAGLERLRVRARTSHGREWAAALAGLPCARR